MSKKESKSAQETTKEYTAIYVSPGGTRELHFNRVGESIASSPDEEWQEAACHAKNCCKAGETLQSVRRNR